jgi:hypothetical protein|tara:strand:+ start:42 stop:395 length:354 start_codon:yes stop_codon:yes gene_type:complete
MPKRIYEILGQVDPTAATETVLYTVPSKRTAIVKVTAFNGSGVANMIKVAVVNDGGSASNPTTTSKDYRVDGFPLGTNYEDIDKEFKGITLNEFDQIRVEATVLGSTFHCYGVEIEP